MADRNRSFFGPVLPQPPDAPEAFSQEELLRIRARRLEVDLLRASGPAWPEHRRFETLLPAAAPSSGVFPARERVGRESGDLPS